MYNRKCEKENHGEDVTNFCIAVNCKATTQFTCAKCLIEG
jgi:hypothetical protein